jgi:hypothetical protein
MLNTAKGVASWFVPVASVLNDATGSWNAAFAAASLLNVCAAMLVFVLHSARGRLMAKSG